MPSGHTSLFIITLVNMTMLNVAVGEFVNDINVAGEYFL